MIIIIIIMIMIIIIIIITIIITMFFSKINWPRAGDNRRYGAMPYRLESIFIPKTTNFRATTAKQYFPPPPRPPFRLGRVGRRKNSNAQAAFSFPDFQGFPSARTGNLDENPIVFIMFRRVLKAI